MKRTNKILAIVLAVAMLAGLLVLAVPASAGDLSWDNVPIPTAVGPSTQIVQNINTTVLAFAPDAKTAFSFDSVSGKLFKSGDAGMTWTNTNLGTNLPAGVIAIAVSPTYATDTTILAATTGALYRSRNGGSSFQLQSGFASVGTITSIDIAPYYISTGGTAMMVAGSTGIALFNEDDGWLTVSNTSQMGGSTNVLKAEFSPNYQNDGEILAVVSGVTGLSATPGNETVLQTKFASANWNTTIRPAKLDTAVPAAITTATTAFLAFPSDYDSSSASLNRVYVALGDNAGGAYDVWRVNGSINSTGTLVAANNLKSLDGGASGNNTSIAFSGTAAAGTLVIGEFDGSVMTATSPNGTAVWNPGAANGPTGVQANVVFPKGSTTLYASSQNAGSTMFGSAISTSTDYSSFKQIAQISVPATANLAGSNWKWGLGTTLDQFILLKDSANKISLVFKSTDAGTTWAEIFRIADGANSIAGISPTGSYGTDNTVFVPNTVSTIWKSTDGGATWNNIAATIPSGDAVTAFAVIDANSYWMGASSGGIYKSGSYAKVAGLDNNVAFAIIPVPLGIVVKTNTSMTPPSGNTSYYLSTDNGATFSVLGNIGQFAGPFGASTFDMGAKIIYASGSTNEIMKWVVGSSTAWTHVVNVTYSNTAAVSVSPTIGWLSLTPNGTLYVTNSDVSATSYQLLRCVNLGAPEAFVQFVGIKGTTTAASDFGNTGSLPAASTNVIYNSTGKFNIIYQLINTAPTTQNGYPVQIKKFTDTLVTGPAVSAPAADTQVNTNFTISWNALAAGSNSVTYGVQIATDQGFNGMVLNTTTNATSYFVNGGLVQGTKYYIRVFTTAPYPSPFSATVPITVKLGQNGNNSLYGPTGQSISPGPGATGIPVNANFQWAAVTGATSYHIQVADNPGFNTPIADATTADTFFTVSSPLNPGTVYYWRVQALSGSIASDYVSNVFTTAAATAPSTATTTQPVQTVQPTIIVTVPPATVPPQTTPAYVWVIIVIGAILVIAVIVLIARTRRV
jgi:trimeric autotransporter adhesin